ERNITAQMSQNITDTVSQLASDVRSLWSVVVAEDTQTENRQINTRNVTNYNHSHALTVQYYEVLHRYRAEVKLNEVVPILYLPYSPLNFDINLIAKYWHLFKNYVNVDKDKLANYQPVIDYYNSGKASNAIVEYRLMQLQVKVNIKRNESNGILEGKLDIPGVISNSTTQTSFDKTNVELVFQYPDTPTSALPITNFKKLFIYSGSESAADIYIRMKFINSSGQERMKEISVNAFALFPDSNGTGGYTQKAEYSLDDDLVASFKAEEKPSDLLIGEIEQIFKSRKYFFTSLLLQSAEPQQLIDLIQGITIKPSNDIGDIYLTDFIDFSPIGVSGNNILFKLKHFVNSESSSSTANGIKNSLQFRNEIISDLANAFENENNQTLKSFREIVAYFEDVKTEVMQKQKNNVSAEDIYLPTSGIFAEAILGRSNASEKIDITRFYNWQDSPIPNLAPQINPVDPNTELKNPPLNTNSNLTPQVLNYFNTPQLPDPTGMTGVMQAIQNGNMFRDMSKSETLLGVLTNLTNFSTDLAKLSSTMAGDTQKSTIAAATEIAKAAVSALNGSGIGGGAGTGGSRTGSGLGSGNGI
ncbi:MAG TPA: hypothetical protein PLD02_16240, partial [Saprospiraceae bacterium]|nr:hypothetical protein [Saprospiraceae bacterium]